MLISPELVFTAGACVFVPTDNVFEVSLVKNTSGLGFSFSRDEHVPDEPHGSSMVRVKKLFPGQPAAESGRIKVGDVILQVNQTHLKGLSQHVCLVFSKLSCNLIRNVIVLYHDVFCIASLTFFFCRRSYQPCEEQDRR